MGKLVSSHLLQGFQGSLPHWHTHKACYVSESGKYVVGFTVLCGKFVGAHVKLANREVPSVKDGK